MPTGHTRSPLLQKGAFVHISEDFLGPVPNVIVFQFNPETLSRGFSPWQPAAAEEGSQTRTGPVTAQPFDPGETINLTLELDAADELEHPERHPQTVISGVADRLAALEMLLYPVSVEVASGLLGESERDALTQAAEDAGQSVPDVVPRLAVPVVLLVWGPGRVLPVRLTSFQIEEQDFSPTLYPVRAEVSVGLAVLNASAFPKDDRQPGRELALSAYEYMRAQKLALAARNLANNVDSILGLLPSY